MNDIRPVPGAVPTLSSQQDAPPLPPTLTTLPQIIARQTGLSGSDLQRIGSVQQQLGLGFIEAAMRLKLIDQTDLDMAISGQSRPATIVEPHAKPSTELLSAHDPFEPYSEGIRALRTELAWRAKGEVSNVVAVMSPARGEGRSRLVAELAVAFAQLGQDTLLVDADLRSSRQHELFGADNDQGLAQALAEGRPPRLQAVAGLPSLMVLTAGPRPKNPLELLSDASFEELVNNWRRRHQHVLIDTPPVTRFADAIAVANQARRVLLVTRRHQTGFVTSRELIRKLQSSRARIVGSVINAF
ncbi:MAG: CpsD/CapB family tyrosine-protein kinase [Panacagrimonas sp.]